MNKASAHFISCTLCGETLSQKRLKASPNARQCVRCLEHAGDVPRVRQFTDTTKDGENIVIRFTSNSYIEGTIQDQRGPSGALSITSSDDSELERPRKALWKTVPMSDFMEDGQ